MGKSPKPLSFLIHPELYHADPALWEKMREQGHTVHIMDHGGSMFSAEVIAGICGYDLVLGRNCWRMFDLDGLNLAIKSARKVKFVPGIKPAKPKKPRKPRKKKGEEDG